MLTCDQLWCWNIAGTLAHRLACCLFLPRESVQWNTYGTE
jgi:hypothetical protein